MQVAFMLQENQIQIILTPETEEEKNITKGLTHDVDMSGIDVILSGGTFLQHAQQQSEDTPKSLIITIRNKN